MDPTFDNNNMKNLISISWDLVKNEYYLKEKGSWNQLTSTSVKNNIKEIILLSNKNNTWMFSNFSQKSNNNPLN